MEFLIAFAVSFVVSLISAVLAQPKPRKVENNVQRQGSDQDLERLYGTRRMSMVVTNASTNTYEHHFGFNLPAKRGLSIQWSPSEGPREPNPIREDENRQYGRRHKRTTMLHMQGPICVKGRKNALFAARPTGTKQSGDAAYWSMDDFDLKINDKAPGDSDLLSRDNIVRTGGGVLLYLRGGWPDDTFSEYGSSNSNGDADAGSNDTWSETIHAYAHAFQDLEKGSAKFSGIPDFSFVLESNKLWNPVTDDLANWNNPGSYVEYNPNWTGRPDNPFLQLLDYLLDDEYGAGFSIDDINLDSFKDAVNLADLEIAVVRDETRNFVNQIGNIEGSWFNGNLVGNLPATTTKIREKQPMLVSNITLSTEDTLADNLGALLSACRGARLFKNKEGKWTINPAWLHEKDMSFSFEGTGSAIYNVPFFPVSNNDVSVKVNGVAQLVGTIQGGASVEFVAGGDQEEEATGSTPVSGFNRVEVDEKESKITVYFDSTPPTPTSDSRYAIFKSGGNTDSPRLSFIPATGTILVNNTDNYWEFTGPLNKTFTGNWILRESNGQKLHEVPNDADDNQVGLQFATAVSAGQTITLTYASEQHFAKKAVAHLVRDPVDVGLDYTAYYSKWNGTSWEQATSGDPDGQQVIRILSDMKYSGVSIDDRYNQCVVKYYDHLLDYDYNEVEWPTSNSTTHALLEAADNNKPLVNTITVNHITDKSNARDYAEFVVRQSRSADQISFKADYTAIGLEPNDIIYVTDPAIKMGDPATVNTDYSMYWRVISTKLDVKGTVDITCMRYEGEDYAHLSELLEERKYTPISSPIPTVTFPASPVTPFTNKNSGFGLLRWEAPASLSNAFSYRVGFSNAKVYSASLSYELGEIVWHEATSKHYTSLVDDNLNNEPTNATDSHWEVMDSEENDAQFLTIQADTDSPETVIPNVDATRYYTYRVQIRTRSGLGSPAYISVNIAALSFGVESSLRLDSTKDNVIVPKYSSSSAWNSGTTYSTGQLVTYSGSYYVSLVDLNSNNAPDTSTSEWRLNVGGLLDFSKTNYELRLYRADIVKPLNLTSGNLYAKPATPEDGDLDSWWIDSVTEIDVTAPAPVGVPGSIADLTDDYISVGTITALSSQSLTAESLIKAIYKDENGNIYTVTKEIPYIISTLGADGIDGGTVAQLSVYQNTTETYDGSGNLIAPSDPSGGSFNFTTGTIGEPTGWSATPPSVTEGVTWVSQQIHVKANPAVVQPEPLGDWGTPTPYATYGGSQTSVQLYAKVSTEDVPNTPADNSLIYDFSTQEVQETNGTPISLTNAYPVSSSGSLVAANWYPSVPDGDGIVWVTQSSFAISGAVGIDTTSQWTDATTVGAQGNSIYNGFLLANVDKDDPAPTKPGADIIAYNFAEEHYELVSSPGVKITQYGDWYTPEAVPSLQTNEEQYVVRETFTSFGGFGTDEQSIWTDPVVYSKNPSDGKSSYLATVYLRLVDGQDPSQPSGGSFNFDTATLLPPSGVVSGVGNSVSWSTTIPEYSEGNLYDVIWATQALATSDDPRGTDSTLSWGVPVIMSRMGVDGQSTDIVFKRSVGNPGKPADSQITPPAGGWVTDIDNVPYSDTAPLWASAGRRETSISYWQWETPSQIQGGVIAEVTLYRRSNGAPAAPANNSATYSFSSASFTSLPNLWYSNIPSPTIPEESVWMSKAVASGVDNSSTVTVNSWSTPTEVFKDGDKGDQGDKGDKGDTGASGVDGKTVKATIDQQAFLYNSEGVLENTGSTFSVNASTSNFLAPEPWFVFRVNNSIVRANQSGSGANSFTYTPPTAVGDMPQVITVEARESQNSDPVIDEITVYGVENGSSALTVALSNEAHAISASNQGIPLSYEGSGTTIQVWEGATALSAVSNAGSLTNGTFTVSVASTASISAGTASFSGNTATFGIASGMSSNTASITYLVTAKTVEGATVVQNRVQSFTRTNQGIDGLPGGEGADGAAGLDGLTVSLSATKQAFTYTGNNTLKDSLATSEVTANGFNVGSGNTPYFRFLKDNGEYQASSTDNSITYTANASGSNLPAAIEVEMRLSASGPIVARDSLTITKVKEGGNSPSVILSNEAHSFPADSAGSSIDYSGSGTTIKAFSGSNACTYAGSGANTFSVSATGNNISPGSISGSGTTVSYGVASTMLADTASIDYTVIVRDDNGVASTVVKQQTFSKSKQGVDGAAGASGAAGTAARKVDLTAGKLAFNYNSAGTRYGTASTTVTATPLNFTGTPFYTFYRDNSVARGNSTDNTYSYTAHSSIGSMPDVIEVEVREGATGPIMARDQLTMVSIQDPADGANGSPGANGEDGITVVLTNEAHTVPAANDGTPSTLANSGTDIRAWAGSTACNYANSGAYTFSVSVSSVSNVSAGSASTVSSSKVRRYSNISSFDTGDDIGSITFNITVRDASGSGRTITKVQSFTKSNAGEKGDAGADSTVPGPPGETGPSYWGGIIVLYTNSPEDAPTTSQLNGKGLTVTGQVGYTAVAANTYAITSYAFGTDQSAPSGANSRSYSWRWSGTSWSAARLIDTDVIMANAIQAEQLQISKGSGADRMFFNGDKNRIEIYAGNQIRIKLGYLGA
jgi:hypothetical protein